MNHPLVIKIDWELYKIDKEFEEIDKAIKVMDVLHDVLTPEYEGYFKEYRSRRERLAEILREQDKASQEFDGWGWVELVSNIGTAAWPAGSSIVKAIAQTAVPVIAEQRKKFSEWFRRRLRPDDYDLYDDPKGELSRLFVSALLKLTTERPLVLMFDTAEYLLHVKWVHSGLMKYTIPQSHRLLLVVAGRIPEEVRTSIRDNIRDAYIYKSDLDTFSRLDIEDYLRLCIGDSAVDIPSRVVDFIRDKTKGIPLAVDIVGNAFAKGYNLQQVFGDGGENVDIDSITEILAYRFLKHCLEDPNRLGDRDFIYTFAVMPDEVENEFPVIDYIWKRVFGEKIDTVEIINRLQSDYSFIFPNRRMHSVVKYFICVALKDKKLDAGRLFEINRAALDYYCSKTADFKDYQTKFRNRTYQEAAIGRLNHLFWLGDIEAGVSFLCEVYNLAVRYGEFEFASRFLATITDKEWLRSRLPTEYNELITALQHFGSLIGKPGDTIPSVAKLKEEIFNRLDTETKILTLIDEAKNAARARNLSLAVKRLQEAEDLVLDNSFAKERADAYRMIGIAARRQGNLDAAIENLNKSYSLDRNVYTLMEIGHTRSQNNEREEAIKIYDEVLKINPSLTFIREAKESLSRSSQAIKDSLEQQLKACYSRLNGLTPGSEKYYRTHSQISKILMQQGKLQEALKARKIAEEGFSHLACTFNKSSSLYLLLGDSETALEKARTALEIGDDNPGTYLSMGDVYRFRGYTTEAKQYYGRAIDEANHHVRHSKQLFVQREGLYGKGLTLLLENDFENGLKILEQAHQIMRNQDDVSNDAQVLVAVGLAFVLNERFRRAEDFFREAIDLSDRAIAVAPSAYEPYYNKFFALVGLSKFDEAQSLLRQCLRVWNAKGIVTLALEKIRLIAKSPRYAEETGSYIEWLWEYL